MAIKCGKKRLLYSENEESVVHSWQESEWVENETEKKRGKKSEIYVRPYMYTDIGTLTCKNIRAAAA